MAGPMLVVRCILNIWADWGALDIVNGDATIAPDLAAQKETDPKVKLSPNSVGWAAGHICANKAIP
jgi:hypothetical protein